MIIRFYRYAFVFCNVVMDILMVHYAS